MQTPTVSFKQKEITLQHSQEYLYSFDLLVQVHSNVFKVESGRTYLLQHLQLLQVNNKNLAGAHGPNYVRAT